MDTLLVCRHTAIIAFWRRLHSMDENRLTKRVFMWDWNQGKTWSHYVHYILRQCEIQIPENLSSVSVDRVFTLSIVEEKLFGKQKNIWAMKLSNQSKLQTYATYKYEYGVEPYVEANLSRSQRSLIARLRSGTLPLNVETMHLDCFKKLRTNFVNFVMQLKMKTTLSLNVN